MMFFYFSFSHLPLFQAFQQDKANIEHEKGNDGYFKGHGTQQENKQGPKE
jgi:hypothetical protein